MATYTLISSNVLASSAASVTFSAIPATYTDLVIKISGRLEDTGSSFPRIRFNGITTTTYSATYLRGDGSSANSARDPNDSYIAYMIEDNASNTSNTFSNQEIYIPSYTASQSKPVGISYARESNSTSTDVNLGVVAGLWRNNAAITEISLTPISTNYTTGSTFYLYGISNV
jgi:hypothetical protein